jgi:hypothetical protein
MLGGYVGGWTFYPPASHEAKRLNYEDISKAAYQNLSRKKAPLGDKGACKCDPIQAFCICLKDLCIGF